MRDDKDSKTSVKKKDPTIKDLIGRKCRVFPGDAGTDDYRPERVNIYRDQDNVIVDINFG
jgi:hypothetical protein